MSDVLEVKHLSVSFFTRQGEVQAVRDVSFSLKKVSFLPWWENPAAEKARCAAAL